MAPWACWQQALRPYRESARKADFAKSAFVLLPSDLFAPICLSPACVEVSPSWWMLIRYLGTLNVLDPVSACNNSLKLRQCNNFLDIHRVLNWGLERHYCRFLRTQNSKSSFAAILGFWQYGRLKFWTFKIAKVHEKRLCADKEIIAHFLFLDFQDFGVLRTQNVKILKG